MNSSTLNVESFNTVDDCTLVLELGLAKLKIQSDSQNRINDLLLQQGNDYFFQCLAIPKMHINQSLAQTNTKIFESIKRVTQEAIKTRHTTNFTWQDSHTKKLYLIQIKLIDTTNVAICIQNATDALKEINEKVYWTELLLNAIADNLPSAVYAKDLEGRKILTNHADCKNAGVDNPEEILGKTDFDLFPRRIAEQFHQDDLTVLRDGNSIIDREESLGGSNEEQKWLRTSKIPMKDATGKIVGLVGFGHDISLEKRLEEENALVQTKIREQQQMVEEMILDLAEIPQKMGELVGGVADMAKRTKMVSINAAIESARVGEQGRGFHIVAEEVGRLSDESSQATTQISDAIQEVNTLVQRILQLWEEVKLD